MKKGFNVLIVAVGLIFALPANAQFNFGLKAGLNVNNVSLSDLQGNLSSDNRTGFFFGPMIDITLPVVGLGIDAAALYDQKHIELDGTSESVHYIDIPINAKYTIGLGSVAGVYVATGPQFSFNVGNNSVFETLKNAGSEFELEKSLFSWNIGAGVKLLSHLQIGYNYNIQIGNTAEFNALQTLQGAATGKLKNNSHQISVAYLF